MLAAAGLYSVPSIQGTGSIDNSCIDEGGEIGTISENGTCVRQSTPTEPQCPRDMWYEPGLGCAPMPNYLLDQEGALGSANDTNAQGGSP